MGREKDFDAAGMASKLKEGGPVVIQFAKAPEVMVVDPEKPSGYNGGISVKLDKEVLSLMAKKAEMSGSDPEVGAYLTNAILLGEGEFDVDEIIGWSRDERKFVTKSEKNELRRLLGYSKH